MARPDEFDNLFDQDEAKRLRADRAAMVERNAERSEQETRAAAARAAQARQGQAEANRRAMLAEYQRAGVRPLGVDIDGYPRVSLTLLRQMGWTIEEHFGERVLVKPPPAIHQPPRERQQS